MSRRKVTLVQQGVWSTPLESLPLAVGYLKAMAERDDAIRSEVDISIANFTGGVTRTEMAERLFADGVPDVLACSVLGWNYLQFGALAETFRQVNPDGWVVWGGTHVANQAERTFRMFPHVDVLVNAEGEFAWVELLRAYLGGKRDELHHVDGISFRNGDGGIVTTTPRVRIQELDDIPSPFLTGAVPLTDRHGRFRYDVALMETNRGCPHRCAFCYWGGATAQKVRAFSRERVREELDLFGRHEVHTVVLCDANFGMLPADKEFLEDLIRTRERHGYPRSLETSWAKNKSPIFYSIVQRMKEEGLRSAFTVALQTLDDRALHGMHRHNMRMNDWEDLVKRLDELGMDSYAELIWGAPGETPESFLEGYDLLSRRVSRVATYPLLLLPNTEYSESRERFGFVTIRGQDDDFEYVLAHNTMSIDDNRRISGFILWARTLAENMYFRHLWTALRGLAGLAQSVALLSIEEWFERSDHEAGRALKSSQVQIGDPDAVLRWLRHLYSTEEVDDLFELWLDDAVGARVDPDVAAVLTEVLRFDRLTRPIYDGPEAGVVTRPTAARHDGQVWLGGPERFEVDVPLLTALLREGEDHRPALRPVSVTVEHRQGLHEQLANHEMVGHFVAQAAVEPLEAERALSAQRVS